MFFEIEVIYAMRHEPQHLDLARLPGDKRYQFMQPDMPRHTRIGRYLQKVQLRNAIHKRAAPFVHAFAGDTFVGFLSSLIK